jgi:long-chain acyl-CoA synthetase
MPVTLSMPETRRELACEDQAWRAFYGLEVRTEIVQPAYRTIPDLVRSVAETYRDAPTFTVCLPNGVNGTLSFAQVDEMSDVLAIYLREVAGLSQGDTPRPARPCARSSCAAPAGSTRRRCAGTAAGT